MIGGWQDQMLIFKCCRIAGHVMLLEMLEMLILMILMILGILTFSAYSLTQLHCSFPVGTVYLFIIFD